jgi:hypothetical protein
MYVHQQPLESTKMTLAQLIAAYAAAKTEKNVLAIGRFIHRHPAYIPTAAERKQLRAWRMI